MKDSGLTAVYLNQSNKAFIDWYAKKLFAYKLISSQSRYAVCMYILNKAIEAIKKQEQDWVEKSTNRLGNHGK